MIGIVVVSHSRALADAALDLARQLAPPGPGPEIAVAAGLDDGGLGTDAGAVADAIARVDSPDGVLVLLDLGSALLSADLALELLDPAAAARVRISPAPLVEGLVAAVISAGSGAPVDPVADEALMGTRAKIEHLTGSPAPGAPAPRRPADDGRGPATLIEWHEPPDASGLVRAPSPHGLHARPAAALIGVLRNLDARVRISDRAGREANPASLSQLARLAASAGAPLTVEAWGTQASEAIVAVAELAAHNFGDPGPGDLGAGGAVPQGIRAGSTIGIGPIRHWRPATPADYRAGSVAVERDRSRTTTISLCNPLTADADPVLSAQAALLDDPDLLAAVGADIDAGTSARTAWADRLAAFAAELDAMSDEYLRERAQDVRAVARMLDAALTGSSDAGPPADGILVLPELDAATARSLDPRRVAGIVTTTGGETGHGVLVAQARGIPILPAWPAAADLPEGVAAAIDPLRRELLLDPTPEQRAALDERERERAAAAAADLARAHDAALTQDGTRILVEVNVSSLADAHAAARQGADGVGVLRTEILFAEATTAPSAEEQAAAYRSIADAVGGVLTVRTWDAGGDKPLRFQPLAPEANPFLGVRGIRATRLRPDLMSEQLRAICLVAADHDVRVLLPMVTSPDEVRWARDLLADAMAHTGRARPIPLGIMVEVPAAAVRLRDFAGLIDFVSYGTNDLAQYTLAVDRGNALVAAYAPPGHPAVLDLIGLGRAALPDLPAAVCGDLASDPTWTERLVTLGITELSVRPGSVPAVKQAVRSSG